MRAFHRSLISELVSVLYSLLCELSRPFQDFLIFFFRPLPSRVAAAVLGSQGVRLSVRPCDCNITRIARVINMLIAILNPRASLQGCSFNRRESRCGKLHCCNLHGACGGKDADISLHFSFPRCNLHGACGGKVVLLGAYNTFYTLQSARGVWKTLHHPPEKNPRKFMQTYCIFIHLAV